MASCKWESKNGGPTTPDLSNVTKVVVLTFFTQILLYVYKKKKKNSSIKKKKNTNNKNLSHRKLIIFILARHLQAEHLYVKIILYVILMC